MEANGSGPVIVGLVVGVAVDVVCVDVELRIKHS